MDGLTNDKGTRLETLLARWLNANGFPHARRIVKKGQRDEGDVTLGDGWGVTVECKNTRSMDLAGGQRELAAEMENAGTEWGFTVHKKRGTTDVGEYYAVLPVRVMASIIKEAVAHRAARGWTEDEGRQRPQSTSDPLPPLTKAEAMEHALATEQFVRKRVIPRRP